MFNRCAGQVKNFDFPFKFLDVISGLVLRCFFIVYSFDIKLNNNNIYYSAGLAYFIKIDFYIL